ncbi:hypothetical protein AMTR_s00012p00250440 [Amborella trichopoda]|uniref:Uncharacterized protein n=1 Tax=Amborella trichopoda TaxID=13333 RepID=W1PJP4_AMBTC|nr:hypothetical protein AMTR_s00012p00250440 [Amborella trichopoda]
MLGILTLCASVVEDGLIHLTGFLWFCSVYCSWVLSNLLIFNRLGTDCEAFSPLIQLDPFQHDVEGPGDATMAEEILRLEVGILGYEINFRVFYHWTLLDWGSLTVESVYKFHEWFIMSFLERRQFTEGNWVWFSGPIMHHKLS